MDRLFYGILLIMFLGISNLTEAQIESKACGKIVDEKFSCLAGVKITNLNTGIVTMSNQHGYYEIGAKKNDLLEFQFIGLTTEKNKFDKPNQKLNLIMMDKEVNCLGEPWAAKQYYSADRRFEKGLKHLYKKASR